MSSLLTASLKRNFKTSETSKLLILIIMNQKTADVADTNDIKVATKANKTCNLF